MLAVRSIALAALVGAVAFAVPAASAQGRPSFALEATIGGSRGRGGDYEDRTLGGARIAASVRTNQQRHVGVFAEVAMDWIALSMGHDLSCRISSTGGCVPIYPELFGPELLVGVLLRAAPDAEVRAGIGGAAYTAGGVTVGGAVAQLDGAIFPARHFGLVGGVRAIVVPRYRHDRLSTFPWFIGVRIR